MTANKLAIIAMMILGACAPRVTNDTFCDTVSPLIIDKEETATYLLEHERQLLEGIVVHNETWESYSCRQ